MFRPPSQKLRQELPVLGGLALGLGLLWWRGHALVLDGRVAGYHWPDWMYGALNHAHGRHSMLDPFRQPLHSALVGFLSEWTGFLDAALLVAGLSMSLVVLAAGLTGRWVGGPWTGALAAAAVPLSPIATSGSRWGTGYPLLTGALAIAIALSVRAAQKGGGWTLAAGGAALVATMADERGLLLLLVMSPLLGWRAIRGWTGRLTLLVVVVGAWTGTQAAPWLGQEHSLSSQQKRSIQTRVVARWATQNKDKPLVEACQKVPQEVLLTPSYLTTPCAAHVLRNNFQRAIPATSAWPLWALILGLLLLVRPRSIRRSPQAALLGIGIGIGVLATAIWTPLPARYQLVYTAFSGLLVPLAIGPSLRGTSLRLRAGVPIAALAVVWLLDPHDHELHPIRGIDARWLQPADIAEAVRRVTPPSHRVRDCAGTYSELALLPDHQSATGPELSIPNAAPCLSWIQGTSPRVLVVRRGKTLPGRQGQVDISQAVAESEGWRHVDTAAGVEIWMRP